MDSTPQSTSSRLHIGTSGWAYPTWKPDFYPAKTPATKFLGYYASWLSSVEVNYTFRALPTAKQLEGWLAAVPDGFRFTFKAPQRITHFSRLRECEGQVEEFVAALGPVVAAGKLGLLFFQLPPNFKADPETLQRLEALLKLPALQSHRLAVEFRHESWFGEPVYEVLRAHDAALCVADSDDLVTPEIHTAGTHVAFRLRRNGGYTPKELKATGKRLAALALDREVYAYLKHEDEPTGPLNAAALLDAAKAALAPVRPARTPARPGKRRA